MFKIVLSLIVTINLFAITKEWNGVVKDATLTYSQKGLVVVGNRNNHLWYGVLNKKAKLVIDKESKKHSGMFVKILKFDNGFLVITNNGKIIKFNKKMKAVWHKNLQKENVKLVSITTLKDTIFVLGYGVIPKYKKFKEEIIIFKLDKNANSLTDPLILGTKEDDIATSLSRDEKNIFLTGFAKSESLKPFVVVLNPGLIKLNDKILEINGTSSNVIAPENIVIGNSETNQIFISKSDKNLTKFKTILLEKNIVSKNAKLINNYIYIVGYQKNENGDKFPIAIKTTLAGKVIWKKIVDKKGFMAVTIIKTVKGIIVIGYNDHQKSFLQFFKYGEDIK